MSNLEHQVENWLISDYVYNPDGSFAGIMYQKRRIDTLPDHRIRVTQQITPGLELGKHPMTAMKGESVYEMTRDGRRWRYQGPDMLGTALAWGSATLTGRGVWTRFGHNFTALAVALSTERQLHLTRFYNAGELIASVAGIAVPDAGDDSSEYPQFSASFYPQETARLWEGTTEGFNAAGETLVTGSESRRYHFSERRGWSIHESSRMWKIDDMENRYGLQEEPGDYGIGKRSGWLFDMEHFAPPMSYSRTEILDNADNNLIIFTRTLEDESLTYFSVTRLKPRE